VLGNPSIATGWISQCRATVYPTGCSLVRCHFQSMFPFLSDNTTITLSLADLLINIPSCGTLKFLRAVLTVKYLPTFRRTYLNSSSGTNKAIVRAKLDQVGLSSGPSRTIVRAKHIHGQSQERSLSESSNPKIYWLTLNTNAVYSSETSAKISQLTRSIILKT
jgi:hypothetical protein